MKKMIYGAALLMAVMTSGCSDFLDQDNRSNIPSEDFYKTKTGFESLVNCAYSSLRDTYGGDPWVFSAGTDLYGTGKAPGDIIGLYGSGYNSSDKDVRDFYMNCYKGIQLANSVIYYGAKTESSSVRTQYLDEARFLRAYYYYLLVQQFGGVALNTEMFDAAVMSHQRESAEKIYEFVISEFTALATNSSLLDRASASGNNFGRANKEAAYHFLAKTYLARGYETFGTKQDFQKAAEMAEKAINSKQLTLAFSDVFNIDNEENEEILWSVQYSKETLQDAMADGNKQQSEFGVYLGNANEGHKYMTGYLTPTLHLHQLFKEGDSRYEATFMTEVLTHYYDFYKADKSGSEVLYYYAPAWADTTAWRNDANAPCSRAKAKIIMMTDRSLDKFGIETSYRDKVADDHGVATIRKFDDPASGFSTTSSTHDIILARLGETYLVAAEAYIKNDEPAKAKVKVDAVRKRAALPGYDLSVKQAQVTGEAGIDFILEERARECAGEYHRWMDLKRTGRLIDYVTRYGHDNIQASDFVGTDGQNKILRPIPLDAINKNDAVIVQNPGF